ncbi:MAG: ABC transporter permease [Oscillospiraceae bacterium]|jgi:peptide/nickel transport system permease protein|nr:ABC transporter permease [Oscillospiraceae bacterium]
MGASGGSDKQKKYSAFGEVWRQLKKNKLAMAGLVIIVLLILIAIFAPVIAPYSYVEQDPLQKFAPSSREHLLGTDNLGRDVLSRLLYGSRQSLQMGLYSVAIAAIIGIIIGAIAGFYGGWLDNLLMRILDIYQCIPMMLLCIVLAAALGPSLTNATVAIGICSAPGYARLIRASILTIRELEYIEAARAIDASDFRIITKHIIPNAIAPMIVQITMSIGGMILSGAMLTYIGLGAQPPVAEWGGMLADGRNYMRQHASQVIYPGICIMISVLSFNLLGDGLRDALDPRLKN